MNRDKVRKLLVVGALMIAGVIVMALILSSP